MGQLRRKPFGIFTSSSRHKCWANVLGRTVTNLNITKHFVKALLACCSFFNTAHLGVQVAMDIVTEVYPNLSVSFKCINHILSSFTLFMHRGTLNQLKTLTCHPSTSCATLWMHWPLYHNRMSVFKGKVSNNCTFKDQCWLSYLHLIDSCP